MFVKKFLVAVCILVGQLAPVRAVVLFSDSFSYANGSLTTTSGFVWITHSGSTGQTQVVSGKVQLLQSQSEDVSAYLAGQPYPANGSTNVFYAAFTLRLTALPSSGGEYFAHFKDVGATAGFRCRVWALTSGATAGNYRLGLSSTSGSTISATATNNLSLNTDYRVVLRLLNTDSVASLWIDPVSESDPAISTSESASAVTVAMFAWRQPSSGSGAMTVDDLVVGTLFADVVSNAPPSAPVITTQPQSQTVTEGANVTFTVGVNGSAPLYYQWSFENTPLDAATNAMLTLSNVTFTDAGSYRVTITNAFGTTNSSPATLTVDPAPAPPVGGFTLLTYNTHGNFIGDWTTNSAQVRAIGRQVQYLDPDIITFQEIPLTNNGWTHMPEFVAAFRPGYYLASNSGSDGFIRSVTLSRYPITRSKSWLDGADLDPFGYTTANFTRDLFETQIAVPGFPQPVHVFTTHLKSGQGTDDSNRRTAEAGAISNYFVTGFLTTNSLHTYVLTGDMNEDIARPPSSNPQSIQKLISTPTGLRLTTPLNPFTGSDMTFSIQAANLTKRYDYILPGGLLFSNIASSQVFRTDLLPSPPPPLLGTDDETASDHLPVLMVFNNPYDNPFRLLAVARSNAVVTLQWESVPGQPYRIYAATNLTTWSVLASNLTATSNTYTFSTNLNDATRFFRVYRGL